MICELTINRAFYRAATPNNQRLSSGQTCVPPLENGRPFQSRTSREAGRSPDWAVRYPRLRHENFSIYLTLGNLNFLYRNYRKAVCNFKPASLQHETILQPTFHIPTCHFGDGSLRLSTSLR